MIEIDALASAHATRAKRRFFGGGFRALFDRSDARPIAAVTEATALTADDALRRFRIGSAAGGTAAATFPGWVGELLVFQSDLGTSEAVIHADVLAAWGGA